MTVNNSSHYDRPSNSFCSNFETRVLINFSFYVVKAVLIIPPCTFIVYLGFQRWRRQHSFKSVHHSDVITFNLAAMELSCGPGLICVLCGRYLCNSSVVLFFLGSCFFSLSMYGEILFHLLTCVDWYLAVVHPIFYLQIKDGLGVQIRNISIIVVWLLSFGLSGLEVVVEGQQVVVLILCFLAFSIVVITFCNFCVLYALIRPGPAKKGGEKERDSHKQRAFHTITAIWVVLCLWFIVVLISNGVSYSLLMSENVKCLLFPCLTFLNLPVSLLLPVLYLHRTRNSHA